MTHACSITDIEQKFLALLVEKLMALAAQKLPMLCMASTFTTCAFPLQRSNFNSQTHTCCPSAQHSRGAYQGVQIVGRGYKLVYIECKPNALWHAQYRICPVSAVLEGDNPIRHGFKYGAQPSQVLLVRAQDVLVVCSVLRVQETLDSLQPAAGGLWQTASRAKLNLNFGRPY